MAQEREADNVRRARKTLPVITLVEEDGPEGPRRGSYAGYSSLGQDEDIIDAEVIDEQQEHPGEQNDSDERRERLRDRARNFFGAKTRDRMTDRERRRRADHERADTDGEDPDERGQLLKMRAETRLAGEKYMETLRDSKLLVPGFNEDDHEQDVDAMHDVHMQMMMQGCLKPLKRGVNPSSIVQAVGMMVAMRMLSEDFKEETNSYRQALKDKIQPRIDARTDFVRADAQNQADKHNQRVDQNTDAKLERRPERASDDVFMAGREAKKEGLDAYLSKKWQRRMEKMEHRDRGNREMFTPESAAMTEVALMENAFWKMRDPENDAGQIHESYRALRKRMRGQMAEDGLDRQEVAKHARMIIGDRMESEPEMRLMFNGMAQGRVVKAGPHAERMAGTDHVRQVWSGEFDDQLGRRIGPDEGMFTLRRPMDARTHQAQLSETMTTSMLDGLERGDENAYKGSTMGYLMGFVVQQQGKDTRGLPEVLQQRMDQSESMLASMDIDGLPPEKQREVYSNAFTDAMEEVGRRHPGIEQDLQHSFGEDWQATLQAAVDDPDTFIAEQRTRTRTYQAGPEQSPHQEKNFDWGFSARENTGERQPA